MPAASGRLDQFGWRLFGRYRHVCRIPAAITATLLDDKEAVVT